MSTNVERKGKEKPKKKGRRKGNQPTIPSLGRELKDRQELKTLSSVPLQMRGTGGWTTQRLVGATGEGGTVLVNVLPDSGCLSLAPTEEKPALPVSTSFFSFRFFVCFFFFGEIALFPPGLFAPKQKRWQGCAVEGKK